MAFDCKEGLSTMHLFVAVHAGAGYHSPNKEKQYKDVCKLACLQAMELLKRNSSAVDAATEATVSLENSVYTNAGIGSNLTMDGTVECDASIMDGKTSLFGAVGALEGVENPIKAATKLVHIQQEGIMSLGRVPPSVLVGTGAKKWCDDNGVETCDPAKLVTDSSKRMHLKYRRKMETQLKKAENLKKIKVDMEAINGIQDTVGAICIDYQGNVAASSSSGGIWLKHSGRLGPAAVYGAGCWAKNRTDSGQPGVAVSTSGTGEDIMRCLLAKTCGDALQSNDNLHEAIETVFKQQFLDESSVGKNGGVLLFKSDESEAVELLWAHTTDSMCIGYYSTLDIKPQTFISRLPEGCQSGSSLTIEGKYFAYNKI